MVRKVKNLEEFKSILKEAGDKLVVVDFTATWCGPCKVISPYYEELAKEPENSDVIFLKVDVDEAEDVSQFCSISAMPTFVFFRKESKLDSFSGANPPKLLEMLTRFRT